ncbi:pitrilysin family protein [Ammoniphilus sp. CFH 90114]|uniref:M16 family metallopeptidase n=1 Tax=Ammoniphilus sp. CFH 90114 TaxID=2493665 RepID=UPI00100FF3A2|nr:pitrilysin family protein [Ammoniphilus sp. CFH 90114]RXT08080.1 insulinase family protein [Ammoniphilus sp. CFH 90114]
MSFQTYFLSNGTRVLIKPVPTSFKVCIDVLVGVGSQYDPPAKKGLAHFVEHMMFRGTKKRGYKQISIDTLKIGGYLNAFTERDTTTYTLDVPYRQMEAALDILLDLYLDPQFPVEDLEKERSIIIEEIDMYNDIPGEFLMDRFMETLYEDHPFGDPILGTKKSVQGITRDDIQSFYNQWYFDSTLTVSVSGRVEASEILPILEEKLGGMKLTDAPREQRAAVKRQKKVVRFHRDVDQGQMIMGVPAPGLEDPDRIAIQVMNAILGGNEISRLYQRIREDNGLAYAVDTTHEAWLGEGCFLVSVGLDPRKMNEVEGIIREEWQRMVEERVTEEELIVARNGLEGSRIMELEGAGAYNAYMGAMAVRGLSVDPEQELQEVQEVTAEDVQRVAKRILDIDHYILAALLPRKKSSRR